MKCSFSTRSLPSLSIRLKKVMIRILLIWAITTTLFSGQTFADAVSDWNATAITVTLRIPNPARSVLADLAYLHIAIYDAVNAIDKRYTVFAVSPPDAVPWASMEAAVHAAAYKMLRTFYFADSIYIDSVYQARIALLPNDSTKTRGIEIGLNTAELFLASRTGDGREANVTYIWQPAGTGIYQPTPPGSAPYQPVAPWQAYLRPFSLPSPSEFRAPGPPAINSNRYTTVYNEVKKFGSLDSTYTTPEQREIARFHTENPGVQVPRNIRLFAAAQGLSLADNARLFAQIYATIGDALITGWDSKYFYNYWRPTTAIRSAGTDGNPATVADTSWLPLVTTPRHPEYPAAHGCVLGSFSYAIEKFFGTPNIPVTLTSNVTGTQHHFNNINEIITEACNARVWGGMHFRSSVEDGVEIGRKVADWVAENKFQLYVPVDELISVLPLNAGTKNALASKLQLAVQAYADERYNAAENLLNALLNQLDQLISNGSVTQAQAQPLIDYVNNYLELIASTLPKIEGNEMPGDFALFQNYPNPFNPTTLIEFSLPVVTSITLKVYDITGREVRELTRGIYMPGTYNIEFDGSDLSSGVYFYTLAGNYGVKYFRETKKLVLIR